MEKNWNIIVPIAIIVLIVVAVIMSARTLPSPGAPVAEKQPVVDTSTTNALATSSAPSVSGHIDDMIGVLTNEASGDAAIASSVAADATIVKNDTQEVNSLTTAYDETTF